jgi:ribosomal protein S18 acetylase RimI-like enzyme
MKIRRVNPDDAQAVFDLFCEVSAEGNYPARASPPSIETFKRALVQVQANDWPKYVAEHERLLVGSASVYPDSFCRPGGDSRLGYLGMQVKHESRGRGYGTALLQALVNHCRQSGFDAIELMVLRSNIAARRLYDGFGFIWVEDMPACTLGSGVVDYPLKMRLAL